MEDEPYPWFAAPINENTNGLLRCYFPKGTDSPRVPDDELAFVVHAPDNRPRKCLGYRTPFEIVHKAQWCTWKLKHPFSDAQIK